MTCKIAVLTIVISAAAAAQSSAGYAFFAPGGATSGHSTTMTLHTGGGVDAIVAKGVGVNVELGAVWPRECFAACVIGLFSPGGTYHFLRGSERKLDPFVAGGYSLAFRNGHANAFYFGGGANYWMSRKVGLRLELRDNMLPDDMSGHLWSVRIGLAFR
jgi:hypothetical protein